MKKLNLFAMGLLAAATSFTACSSNDDLSSGTGTGESKANGFYMTLTVQTPTSSGTRTTQPTEDSKKQYGTTEESDVTSGTLFLVDKYGKTVFTKSFTQSEWENSNIPTQDGTSSTTGKAKTIKLEVQYVTEGDTYNVYFLANNTSSTTPWKEDDLETETLAEGTDASQKFSYPYSKDKGFVMFNQNDDSKKADKYTVTFAEENKDKDHAATVKYDNGESAATILLDRLVARIDQPTNTAASIGGEYPEGASEVYKKAIDDAKSKVKSIELTQYALANMPNVSYVMQHWSTDWKALQCPWIDNTKTVTYQQPTDDFGTITEAQHLSYFNAWNTENSDKFYVLENWPKPVNKEGNTDQQNYAATVKNSTAMYFEYKVTLTDGTTGDFIGGTEESANDGTFYRYNNVIYTKISDILTATSKVTSSFAKVDANFDVETAEDKKGTYDSADDIIAKIKAAKEATNSEEALGKLRAAWGIEIFNKGLCYYKQMIMDNNVEYYAVLRNTIYQLNVTKVFNVGADVPNGKPTEDAYYYLNCDVAVNQWVLNSQDVSL